MRPNRVPIRTPQQRSPAPPTYLAQTRSQLRLASGYGRIVAELFDLGQSATIAWARRPQAAALAAAGQ